MRKLLLHCKIKASIEVKGHVQHIDGKSYNCGKLAKLPNFGGMTLDEMESLRNTSRITVPAIKRFAQWVDAMTGITDETVRAYYEHVRKFKNQPPLPCATGTNQPDDTTTSEQDDSVELKPRTSSSRSKSAKSLIKASSGVATGDSYEIGFQVCLKLARKLGRVPTTEEVLDHLRGNGLYTGPWEDNQAKRAGRITYNLAYISQTFDPAKLAWSVTLDLDALDLTEHVGWVEQHYPDGIGCASVEDVNVFLAITKFCLVLDPNENGSLPFERFKSIWQKLYKSGLLKRQFRWDRWRLIRDRMKSDGVVEVFGKPERRIAQKWKLGHNFPDYANLSSLLDVSPSSTAPLSTSKQRKEEGGSDLTLCLQDEIIQFHLLADEACEFVHAATFGCRTLGEERE